MTLYHTCFLQVPRVGYEDVFNANIACYIGTVNPNRFVEVSKPDAAINDHVTKNTAEHFLLRYDRQTLNSINKQEYKRRK